MRGEGKHEDLQIRTKEFALRVIRMYSALPKSTEARVLGKQVLRSGTSIGANYRARRIDRVRNRSSLPRLGIASRNSTRLHTGLSCWLSRRWFPKRDSPNCAMNAINSRLSSPPSQRRRRPMPHGSYLILHPSQLILLFCPAPQPTTWQPHHSR